MPKEKTMEEVRKEFLDYIKIKIDYWDNVDRNTTKEKLEGLAFSILVALDGCHANLPCFIVAPLQMEDDKEYCIQNGVDYYPNNLDCNVKCDIAGELENYFLRKDGEE